MTNARNNERRARGVTIADDLSWSENVDNVATRKKWTDGFLRRNFKECTRKVKLATYATMVHSTLDYASAVWGPHKQDIKRLEKGQRQAASYMVNNYTDRSPGSVTPMLEKLEWASLEEGRHIRLRTLGKTNNNNVGIIPTNFIHHSDSRTRGAQQIGHPVLFNSVFSRSVPDWNRLLISFTSVP